MDAHKKNIASSLEYGPEKECRCSRIETTRAGPPPVNDYPLNYEKKVITRTGIEIYMRPVKPEDAPMLLDMYNNLSPRTKYYRFFTPMKVLPGNLLKKFTQIDYKKDMALIALKSDEPESMILAAARFISKPGCPDAEFAVVCRDAWQGKGIGRVLMENIIEFAREKQIESISGYVLAENIYMLSLARRLGFCLSKIPGEDQYFLKIDLK